MGPEVRTLADRILTFQIQQLARHLDQAQRLLEAPPRDTPAAVDLDHIRTHRNSSDMHGLRSWAHRSAALNMSAAREHIEGVRAVLKADELLPLPAMALGRSVYEAAINTCWLIDSDVPTEQRLARWAGRLLHDSQEPIGALDSFGDLGAAQQERVRVEQARRLGQDLMTRAGFELHPPRPGKQEETGHVTYQAASSGLKPNVSKLVERLTPDSNLWLLFSGATHSRGWLVNGLWGPDTDVIASVILPLLDTSDALAVEVASYLGMDPRPIVTRTHRHRISLIGLARAGDGPSEGVDTYRARGGAKPLPPKRP